MFFVQSFSSLRNQAYLYIRFGAQYGPLVSNGEWYRVITAIFVHGGLLHLLFNSYALFYFGNIVESIYGVEKFVFIYLLTGVVGNLATQFLYYRAISVGASGSIFGLVGVLFALGFRRDTPFFMRQFTGYTLLPMIIFNIVYGFIPGSGINNAAHIGGFVTGMALGYIMTPRPAYSFWKKSITIVWKTVALLCAGLVVLCFILLVGFSTR
ncbi:MAG TPA: rhomboid family intramembrane serine protease [Pseudothermotoga sp.]|nr:rhomboid family intramembrane serine protease [Pseudothermotoga sp.]HOK83674.1 rhomboid family intramembrane serine protease [Pseudothermotoga sp.]HPP69313.1 rhomboid family intramembrane serine protease [Pseudothermotoga sp.]